MKIRYRITKKAAALLLRAADQSYKAALESYHYGVPHLLVMQAQRNARAGAFSHVLARAQVLTALAAQTCDSIQPHGRPGP
ncbi:hypothetical protein [Edaphobacter aggregans]|uniref:hypothetical protein n=1 Tax=Edaphobacter aggregans TaxID=570835 RepID=UPI000554DCD7|nr:hypothetical protein [Edaphobacter aggregans]